MGRRIIYVLFINFLVFSSLAVIKRPSAHAKEGKGQAPVILDYHAANVIRPGATWKVFLHGRDNDGDMEYIAAILSQTGYGYYSTDFTYLTEGRKGEFEGYLFLNTPVDPLLIFDHLELTLLIRDDQSNRSELVRIPLRFDFPVERQQIPDTWLTAAKKRLGAMWIDLWSSEVHNSRGG